MKSEKRKVNLALPAATVLKLDELARRGHRHRTNEVERLIEEEHKRQAAPPPTS